MPVSSGTFTTSNIAGDSLLNVDILTLFNSQPIWLNKIQGFLNMRASVKLRLVINPTPFQAGLLRIGYFPCANLLGLEMQSHLLNRMTISQTPGCYLNLNSNFVELTVPYVAPVGFIERDLIASNLHASWGNVFIHVMEPLRTGTGSTSINWTLWMSLENLELSGMVQPQMAGLSRRAPIEQEQNDGKGPVTRIMSSGVRLANDIAKIPSLAPLATPASWILSAAHNLCESFGWSKPLMTEKSGVMVVNQNRFAVNSRGADNCDPLSLDPDNKVQTILDASPGGMDEMSFQYVNRHWSWFREVQWSTSASPASLLFDIDVSPFTFGLSQTVGGVSVFSVAPCSVSRELYSLYRGSFEIRVRLVKTGFHTGTLAVGFVPGMEASTPSYFDSAYVYRQIIDIQDGSEFIFNLPYMLPQEFADVSQGIGKFFVYIVNPLVAPAAVSSTIDVFMEVRGGPDLQYAAPHGCAMTPFVPQAIGVEDAGESTAITLGSSNHERANLHHAATAIGEIQKSFLELLKAQFNLLLAPATPYVAAGTGVWSIAVNRVYAARYNGISTESSELGGDPISFVASWYAMSRGSTRYRIVPRGLINTTQETNVYRAMLLTNSSQDVAFAGPYAGFKGPTYVTDAAPNSANNAMWSSLISATNPPAAAGSTAGYSNRVQQIPFSNGGHAVQAPFYSK